MKKMYRAGYGLALVLGLSLFSCKENNDLTNVEDTSISDENELEIAEKAKVEFSKALVKSLQDKEVREFLKSEATSQYDGDYDVLYALVKDKTLSSGVTFEQILSKYSADPDYKSWSEKLPLMTIFVPSIQGFSADLWDVNSQIPDVVIDNDHLKDKTEQLKAFSADLREYEINSKKAPSIPVVVIKENERIVAKSKSNTNARKTGVFDKYSTRMINENDTHTFYFIGDYDYKAENLKRTARVSSTRNLPTSLIFYNQHKGGRPNIPGTQRDWVYYRIWPYFNEIELVNPYINGGIDYDWSKGTLGGTYYTEKLTGFKFSNLAALQNITENWAEGNLEFHVFFSFIDKTFGLQTDLKVINCSASDLKDSNNNLLDFDPNVELLPWDVYRWGDEWKFSIVEHDAGNTSSLTITTKSTYGSNFEGNGGVSIGIVKLGVKYNGTQTDEQSFSSTQATTDASDNLGDARFLFEYPIVTPGYTTRFTVGTGSLDIAIEPVIKDNDPRPYPYID